jgi:hypothetical protein
VLWDLKLRRASPVWRTIRVFLVVIVARSGGTCLVCFALLHFGVLISTVGDASNVDVDEKNSCSEPCGMLTETGDGLGTAAMTSRRDETE